MTPLGAVLSRENASTRPHRVVDFPGPRGEGGALKVAIVSVGYDELAKAQIAAVDHLKTLKATNDHLARYPELLDLETKVQGLAVALKQSDKITVPFATAAEIRMLEPDEIEALYAQMSDFAAERNAFRDVDSLAKLDEVLGALGKDDSASRSLARTYWTSFDSGTRWSIFAGLADRYLRLTRASSPTTGPSSDTST